MPLANRTTISRTTVKRTAADEAAMSTLAEELAPLLKSPATVFLHGDLGAGKTTLVREILRTLGWAQAVKSPTYTLLESYTLGATVYHHFDLYRLADPEELEFLGIRDYVAENTVCFFEWPDRGRGMIPAADMEISIEYAAAGRKIELTGSLVESLAEYL